MKLSFTPIDMILAPNDFTDKSEWNVTQGTAETLYLRLLVNDALGTRRYIPASGATLKLVFMRARYSTLGQPDSAQTFEVSATALADDRSIWSCALTATQINTLFSGTVKCVLTIGTTVYTINKPYAIRKTLVTGGC